jgi:hypothetical protein
MVVHAYIAAVHSAVRKSQNVKRFQKEASSRQLATKHEGEQGEGGLEGAILFGHPDMPGEFFEVPNARSHAHAAIAFRAPVLGAAAYSGHAF